MYRLSIVILMLVSCVKLEEPVISPTITPPVLTVEQKTPGVQNFPLLFDGNLKTHWSPGGPIWDRKNFPAKLKITLSRETFVSKVRVFDFSGDPNLKLSSGGWSKTIKLDLWGAWREIPVNFALKELLLEIDQLLGADQVTEVEVYSGSTLLKFGQDTPIVPNPPPPPPPPNPTNPPGRGDADKVNLCGFHWVPVEKLKPFRFIRPYMATNWLWQPGGLYSQPMYQAGSPKVMGLDDYFSSLKTAGIIPVPCINQTPIWSRKVNGSLPEGDLGDDLPPLNSPSDNRTDPKSYSKYAEFWFQFIARYGSVKHPLNLLRVDKTPRWAGDIANEPKTGLNLLTHVEVWNEPDKWWKTNAIYMTPEEYAAMLSISYDRIKAADPNIKVVMGGLTGFDLKYLTRMNDWFKSKGMAFKADVINVHHYSNRGNKLGQWPPTWYEGGAVPPELDEDFQGIIPIVNFSKGLGKPIWVTEFGTDSKPPSWMCAQVPGITSEALQGYWLARTYLEYLRLGVDNLFMFNAINEPGELKGGLYQNSGLLTGLNSPVPYTPKESYHIVSKLIEALTGATYYADLSTTSAKILSFKMAGKTRIFYWSPTMTNKIVQINIGGRTYTATENPQHFDIL